MNANIERLLTEITQYNNGKKLITLKENELLSRHSSFKIGGPARIFAIPTTYESLIFLLKTATELNVRYYILGNGSNILFDDDGFNGLVISSSAFNKIEINENKLSVGCGAMLTACAVKAKEASLTGMECLFGIPGTIGGAVYMNAGAYGTEMCDITAKTKYIDLETMTLCEVEGDNHKFGYRHSIFKEIKAFILESELVLEKGNLNDISSAMDDYKQRRIFKQPLEYPSAGSTFKRYPGRYTGQMIDELGLKGRSVGGAQVSEKHAGFIINKGCATCNDVLTLIEIVKSEIRKAYGIEIETEVIYVK